jgi:hypothetical protein
MVDFRGRTAAELGLGQVPNEVAFCGAPMPPRQYQQVNDDVYRKADVASTFYATWGWVGSAETSEIAQGCPENPNKTTSKGVFSPCLEPYLCHR